VFVLLISIRLSNPRCAMKFLRAPSGVVARSRFQFENVYVASLYNSSLSERVIGKHSLFPSVSDPPPLLSLLRGLAWSKPTFNGLFTY
jgi:hypothetical protein